MDVPTPFEEGSADLDDDRLLARATELGRVLFTQDDDLLRIAARWLQEARDFGGLFYAHQFAVTVGAGVKELELAAKCLSPAEVRSRVLYLPL